MVNHLGAEKMLWAISPQWTGLDAIQRHKRLRIYILFLKIYNRRGSDATNHILAKLVGLIGLG